MQLEKEMKFIDDRLADCDAALMRARRIAGETRFAGGEFGERYVEPALANIVSAIDNLRAITCRLVRNSQATSPDAANQKSPHEEPAARS